LELEEVVLVGLGDEIIMVNLVTIHAPIVLHPYQWWATLEIGGKYQLVDVRLQE
jgi:hypothetical protein